MNEIAPGIALLVGMVIVGVMVFFLWEYIIMFLAICGAFALYRAWQNRRPPDQFR